MMNAAWARLMMFRMPQTSEKPSPIRARMQPWSSPLMMCWRKSRVGLPCAPGNHRPQCLGLGDVRRPDGRAATTLPLLYNHRLGGVDPALVEFDHAVEGREAQLRNLVAHLLGIEAASGLDRLDEGDAARRAVGALIRGLIAECLLERRVVGVGCLEQIVALEFERRRPLGAAPHEVRVALER